jgi:hypothetical protein
MAEGRRIRAETARLMFGSKATEITTGRKGGWGSILFARLSDMR